MSCARLRPSLRPSLRPPHVSGALAALITARADAPLLFKLHDEVELEYEGYGWFPGVVTKVWPNLKRYNVRVRRSWKPEYKTEVKVEPGDVRSPSS